MTINEFHKINNSLDAYSIEWAKRKTDDKKLQDILASAFRCGGDYVMYQVVKTINKE